MHRYQDLKVWQKARELTKIVYELSASFPESERFGLQSQIRRAACSVMLNISEGAGRSSKRDFSRFLDLANGSNNEVLTASIIATDLSFLSGEQFDQIQDTSTEISKMLYALRKSLSEDSESRTFQDIELQYRNNKY